MTRTSQAQTVQELAATLAQAYQFWNAGNADQAELLCRNVLAVWPGQADALHLLGLMAHAYGNADLALDYLREACRAPRAPGMFFRNLAEMCRRRGLLVEGEQAGRQAVRLDPEDADGWNNLGIILQERGQVGESIDALKRALRLRPHNPQILNNLGNSCRLAGLGDEAERCYRSALEQAPDSAQSHNNLSALAAMRGDFAAGIAHARAAIECEPHFVEAYLNLADIENARFNRTEALRWLDALQAFAPEHVGALNIRVRVLLQAGLTDAASESAHRAVALAPEDGVSLNRLGDVLRQQNRPDEAMEGYRRAAALPGLHGEESLLSLAGLLLEGGRLAEAREVFEQARAQFPASVRVLTAQADSKTYRAGDPDIARLETLAFMPGTLDFSLRLGVHFALGKALLDLGDAPRALRQLEQGNRLKRATFAYDADQTGAWLAQVAAAFADPLPAGAAEPDALMPVFIVGMPRSGSSLIEQILASHPQVAGAGELPALRLAVERAGPFPQSVADWDDARWRAIGQDYLQACHALGSGKRVLIDKMPANFLYAGVIARALPGARIIHCRRDPVDTCMSCYSKLFVGEQPFSYDLGELGQFYRDYRRLMAHWHQVLPAGTLLDVDYETVVDDLEGQGRRLLDFLGLPWDAACLRFYETRRQVRTASLAQVRMPIYRHAIGRWHDCAAQLEPLLAALGDDAS